MTHVPKFPDHNSHYGALSVLWPSDVEPEAAQWGVNLLLMSLTTAVDLLTPQSVNSLDGSACSYSYLITVHKQTTSALYVSALPRCLFSSAQKFIPSFSFSLHYNVFF